MPFLKNADVKYLLYILNNNSVLKFKISKRYLKADNRFQLVWLSFCIDWSPLKTWSHLKIQAQIPTKVQI